MKARNRGRPPLGRKAITAAQRGHPNRKIAGMAREALEPHWRGDIETMARINIEMMKRVLKRITSSRSRSAKIRLKVPLAP
jgi:hypothetical protein